MRIAELLKYGQDNAISRQQIMALTGLDTRALQLEIARERKQGEPIIADGKGGLYLSDNPAEIEGNAKVIESTGNECIEMAAAMRQTAQKAVNGGDHTENQ